MSEPAGSRGRVLVIEDDDLARAVIADTLRADGYQVDDVAAGEAGLRALSAGVYDVVLLDLHLPGMQGTSVLSAAQALQLDAQIVVMTAFGSIDGAVEAVRLGAHDYLVKPLDAPRLAGVVQRAAAERALHRSAVPAAHQAADVVRAHLIGQSPAMERLFELIERVAKLRATVLITGESGTGKELVAQAIHAASGRARHAFIAVNCSALPDTLLEAELFGHVKGSFTGAVSSRRGHIEEAAGGTLFLDEVAAISSHVQVALLRVLEEHLIHRVGSSQPVPVDFRLLVATNENLPARVQDGTFREDLYYRLNVFPIRVPSLRERASDIVLLAEHFRRRFAEENGLDAPPFSTATLLRMSTYDWPGNVRELEHFVERAVILSLGSAEIRYSPWNAAPEQALVQRAVDETWDLGRVEREHILAVLDRTGGHRGRAAEILGIDRRTLYRKLRALEETVPA